MSNAEIAALKCDYQLQTCRAKTPRKFSTNYLSGDNIDCSREPGQESIGIWLGSFPEKGTVEEWIERYLAIALDEAVHEVLEYFQVDGGPYIDPHRLENKIAIHEAVMRFWKDLMAITTKE
jgi:hypothetical protein